MSENVPEIHATFVSHASNWEKANIEYFHAAYTKDREAPGGDGISSDHLAKILKQYGEESVKCLAVLALYLAEFREGYAGFRIPELNDEQPDRAEWTERLFSSDPILMDGTGPNASPSEPWAGVGTGNLESDKQDYEEDWEGVEITDASGLFVFDHETVDEDIEEAVEEFFMADHEWGGDGVVMPEFLAKTGFIYAVERFFDEEMQMPRELTDTLPPIGHQVLHLGKRRDWQWIHESMKRCFEAGATMEQIVSEKQRTGELPADQN